jgi:hypothetical protein
MISIDKRWKIEREICDRFEAALDYVEDLDRINRVEKRLAAEAAASTTIKCLMERGNLK